MLTVEQRYERDKAGSLFVILGIITMASASIAGAWGVPVSHLFMPYFGGIFSVLVGYNFDKVCDLSW